MPISGKYVLLVFFLVIFLGAIILGPLLYFGLGWVWPVPFHRAMDRALLISAVAALGLFGSRIPLGKLWPLTRHTWLEVLFGYAIAAVSIQAILGLDLAVGGFTSAHLTGSKAAQRILLATVAALLVPPLEETVFRGFLQVELIERLGQRAGLFLGAVIFMLAHFLKIPTELDQQPVHLWSGASALGAAFAPVLHGQFLCAKGVNLFLIGLILGGIFLRSGTLWTNAGLHSGLIFALLVFTDFARPAEPPRVPFFGGDILSNLATTLVLVLLALWIWRYFRHPSDSPEAGENAG
jgi:membrane protease YdiL (CAAX protease family)